MDSNLKALAHVQNALLAALASTHAEPHRLQSAFDFYLGEAQRTLEDIPQMQVYVNAWAKTFRQYIPASAEPHPPG